jgi:hypothetical protein
MPMNNQDTAGANKEIELCRFDRGVPFEVNSDGNCSVVRPDR